MQKQTEIKKNPAKFSTSLPSTCPSAVAAAATGSPKREQPDIRHEPTQNQYLLNQSLLGWDDGGGPQTKTLLIETIKTHKSLRVFFIVVVVVALLLQIVMTQQPTITQL